MLRNNYVYYKQILTREHVISSIFQENFREIILDLYLIKVFTVFDLFETLSCRDVRLSYPMYEIWSWKVKMFEHSSGSRFSVKTRKPQGMEKKKVLRK